MIATLSATAMTTDVAALHEVVFAEEGARREQWNAIVPVRTRWEVLTSLPMDWDGNGSPPPDPRGVEAAIRLLAAVAELGPGLLPKPHVVPLSGGGVHFEWVAGARQLQVAIFPDNPWRFPPSRRPGRGGSRRAPPDRLGAHPRALRVVDTGHDLTGRAELNGSRSDR